MNEYWTKLYVNPVINKYVDQEVNNHAGQPLREWAAYGRMFELDRKSNEYTSKWMEVARERLTGVDRYNLPSDMTDDTDKPNFTKERMDQIEGSAGKRDMHIHKKMQGVYDAIVERHMTRLEKNEGAFYWYNKYRFGATRGFHQTAVARPDLAEGVRWLSVIRTGFFPEPKNHECPWCRVKVQKDWMWAHLMVKCKGENCQNARQQWLYNPILNIAKNVRESDLRLTQNNINGVNDQNSIYGGVVSIFLVGGVVEENFDYPYSLSFGQCDGLTTDLNTYGYVYVTSFLQKICPKYCTSLGMNAYGTDAGKLL